MSNEIPPIRIRAFIGRSFLEQDERLWYEVRKLSESLRPIGFDFEDAKEAQLRPISDKVRQGVERNDFYIGILTRRLPVGERVTEPNVLKRVVSSLFTPKQDSQWTTSNWVVQESGYALGKGKRVLLLIEVGVDFPTADLDADTEWIPFDRSAISECSTRLVSMIGNLISEKLPVVPATVQVAPLQDTSSSEEMKFEPSPVGAFSRVIGLLNQGKFGQADEEFEKFFTSIAEEPLGQWWRYLYLRRKSVKGDSASLAELKRIVQAEPQNVDARVELAHYYGDFKNYGKQVEILRDGVQAAPEEAKTELLQSVAETLAKDEQQAEALQIIRDLLPRLTDPTKLRSAFLSLANIAKNQPDRELESAALEHVLDLDPSDSDIRFRLAYLYGEMGKRHLSAYHYKLRLSQGLDATSLNNLGVAYSTLKLSGKEIQAFEKAAEDSLLAKANLSRAYVDRGFLTNAEQMATEVTKADYDETARNRALGALSRISTIRSSENDTEEKILAEAKEERLFRWAYAEAFVASTGTPINGSFETPRGKISFRQERNQLFGEGQFEQPTFGGLFATLSGGNPARVKITTTVKIEANMIGRSGRFKLETDEKEKGTTILSTPTTTTIHGLIVLSEDGQSFEVLEEHETRVKIYKAQRSNLDQLAELHRTANNLRCLEARKGSF